MGHADHQPNCERRIFLGSTKCTCGADELNAKEAAKEVVDLEAKVQETLARIQVHLRPHVEGRLRAGRSPDEIVGEFISAK